MLFALIEALFANLGLGALPGSIETLRRMVELSDGITILPELASMELTSKQQEQLREYSAEEYSQPQDEQQEFHPACAVRLELRDRQHHARRAIQAEKHHDESGR